MRRFVRGRCAARPEERALTEKRSIVIFGLAFTSSWGNGHATTYRGLIRGLAERGHDVLFLERDRPWYAQNRDLPESRHARVHVYSSIAAMKRRFERAVREADLVIVGSYVPDGIHIGEWVTRIARGATAFYDIDTPVTLAKLERGDADYISARLIPRFHLYLSFTGGPVLRHIEEQYGARMARPFFCSVDPDTHYSEQCGLKWDLGYMGTYSPDRQPALERMMLEPARISNAARMVVAGAQYPQDPNWPPNVRRISHLPPAEHRRFYCSQRFTLNLTRKEMRQAGYSPSVRLFEAAACGTAILSDEWPGLDTFFNPGSEILITRSARETLKWLNELPESRRAAIGANARARVLREHTALHRAAELESYISEALRTKRATPQRSLLRPAVRVLKSAQQARG